MQNTSLFPGRSAINFFTVVCCLIFLGRLQAQGQLRHQAEKMFLEGDYWSAAELYRQADITQAVHKSIRLHYGISLYESNDVDNAIRVFQSLINEGKTEAPVFFFMAKCQQAKKKFPLAISFYKKFLQRTENSDPLRTWVKDELIRCANGARLIHAPEKVYLENAGPEINSPYAEYGVHTSPTIIDKIYFTSNRKGNRHHQNFDYDIYSASLINGRWSLPSSLPSHINGPAYNEVTGFSSDGQILYYLTTSDHRLVIMADTFSGEEGVIFKGIYHGPYQPETQGTDLTFFNDTICLFASDMHGGYGGYDLYISVFSQGTWSGPLNLGPTVNSFYNERYPFLTRDGHTIFYSSDNLESIGGYDVFTSDFDAEQLSWSIPENAGFPINSSQDDTHFVIAPDGLTAYLSSDRKEGFGEYDLYRVFFKDPVEAHQKISLLPTFYQVMQTRGADKVVAIEEEEKVEIKEYFISHLFIDKGNDILTPQNTKKLDLLANLMLIYPRIQAELLSFTLPEGPRTFSLFFSIKEAEKAATYLMEKGISKERILVKGYGSSFPLAIKPPGMENSPVYLKLNHRLEINLHKEESEPVITHLENIPVPENILDPAGDKFISLRHGLYYSVQIALVSQMLQNQNLESVNEMFIEMDPLSGQYKYMVGMAPSFSEALQRTEQMKNIGFYDAFIVPYFDGIRLRQDEIESYITQFPDLELYLDHIGK